MMSSLQKKITIFFCACNAALFAQTTNIIGQSTIAPTPVIYTGPLSFLLIPTDARSMGLGCSGAATEPDDFSGLGARFTLKLDKWTQLSIVGDLNKLLVPTPPVYQLSPSGKMVLNSNGQPVILAGMNPDVSAPEGMAQSFYDAPGGALQEFQEITWSTGIEYTYADMFATRVGYFYENPTEGGRQFFTMGAGFRLTRFTIDASYVIPVTQQSPLQNTLCISMSFNLSSRKH